MRCFFALSLPDAAREALSSAAAGFRSLLENEPSASVLASGPKLAWVNADAYHLTLAFLGEIEGAALELAAPALDAAIGTGEFSFSLVGIGAFPSKSHARVLIARIEDYGRSKALYRRINAALEEAASRALLPPLNPEWSNGGKPGGPAFSPHITLARRSDRGNAPGANDLSAALDRAIARAQAALAPQGVRREAGGRGAGPWTIDRCALYKSELRRSGAVYTELRSVGL